MSYKVSDKIVMQTVQTQIRLLLQEQSDQGLHCLPFYRSWTTLIAIPLSTVRETTALISKI